MGCAGVVNGTEKRNFPLFPMKFHKMDPYSGNLGRDSVPSSSCIGLKNRYSLQSSSFSLPQPFAVNDDESIVIELKFGRKKICFTVLYRSPAFNHASLKFQTFLSNFKHLNLKIKGENPFATFFTGDFNAHSKFWWHDGDTNAEGMEIDFFLLHFRTN